MVRGIRTAFTNDNDITIQITPGSNADNTPANLAISRTVTRVGAEGTIDLSTAMWQYYVINQETRVDGDTTMMETVGGMDNVIAIRRGIIEDSDTITGVAPVLSLIHI